MQLHATTSCLVVCCTLAEVVWVKSNTYSVFHTRIHICTHTLITIETSLTSALTATVMDFLNLVCLASSNSALVYFKETAILTTYSAFAVAGAGVELLAVGAVTKATVAVDPVSMVTEQPVGAETDPFVPVLYTTVLPLPH